MISPSSIVINMYNYLLGIMKKCDSLPIAVYCDNGKYMIFFTNTRAVKSVQSLL